MTRIFRIPKKICIEKFNLKYLRIFLIKFKPVIFVLSFNFYEKKNVPLNYSQFLKTFVYNKTLLFIYLFQLKLYILKYFKYKLSLKIILLFATTTTSSCVIAFINMKEKYNIKKKIVVLFVIHLGR